MARKNHSFSVSTVLLLSLLAGTAAGLATGLGGCAGPQTAPDRANPTQRTPASPCDLKPRDEAAARGYLEDPKRADRIVQSRLRAIVQGYLYGEELTEQFDAMIAKRVLASRLYTSQVYARLLALRAVMEGNRQVLEDIYIARIAAAIDRGSPGTREGLIQGILAGVKGQLEEMIAAKASDRHHARLATLDLEEDFEGLAQYYVACDPTALEGVFEKNLVRRKTLIASAHSAGRLPKNAHQNWAPAAGEKSGLHVVDQVEQNFSEVYEDLQGMTSAGSTDPGRAPQSTAAAGSAPASAASATLRPDAGPRGNITGSGFPRGVWALTFDDGPSATLTPKVLENLRKHQIPATFFVLSNQLGPHGSPGLARTERQDGHGVGCHSYTHPQVNKLGAAARHHEIEEAADVLTSVLGERPKFYRLPYGAGVSVPTVRAEIAAAGMIHVFWNVDTLDWHDKNPDSVYQRALKQIRPLGRGVILFHDIHPQSVIASERVMAYLTDPKNALRPVTVPDFVQRWNAGER